MIISIVITFIYIIFTCTKTKKQVDMDDEESQNRGKAGCNVEEDSTRRTLPIRTVLKMQKKEVCPIHQKNSFEITESTELISTINEDEEIEFDATQSLSTTTLLSCKCQKVAKRVHFALPSLTSTLSGRY